MNYTSRFNDIVCVYVCVCGWGGVYVCVCVSSIAYTLQYLLGRFNEELFPEDVRCKHRRKKNQVNKIFR